MYSYSPKGYVTASTPSALVWETSLSKVHDLADEKLLQLSALQESVKPIYKTGHRDNVTRPTSAPKSRLSSLKENQSNSHGDKSDQKLESLFRRLKLLDEKLKRSEQNAIQTAKAFQDQSLNIVQLRESQAAERRAINAMQDSIGNLNSQVGILAHKDEIIERTLQKPHSLHLPQSIDVDAIKEVIFQRVQDEFGKVVHEVVKACAAEQAHFLSKWAERSGTDSNSNQKARNSLDDSHDVQFLEKEAAKLKAESARQKLRLDALESSHHNLRDLAKDKITAAEESQRRLHSSHKVEIQAMLDTVGRRFNELLNATDPSTGIQNLESEIKIVQKKLRSLETSYSSILSEVTRITGEGVAETKEDSAAASRLEVIRRDVEDRLAGITRAMDDHILDSRKTTHRLSESNKKTRAKVNDLAAGLASVSQTRRSVELLLQEVDAKAHDDASWSYQFKTATQKLDQRVTAIENKSSKLTHSTVSEDKLSAIDTRLRDAESRIHECQEKVHSAEVNRAAESSVNVSLISQRTAELNETVALELRAFQSRLTDVEIRETAAAAEAAAVAVRAESIESRLQQTEDSIRDCIQNNAVSTSSTNPPIEAIAQELKEFTSSNISDLSVRVEALERSMTSFAEMTRRPSGHGAQRDTNEETKVQSVAEARRESSPAQSRLQQSRSSDQLKGEKPPRAPAIPGIAEASATKGSGIISQGQGQERGQGQGLREGGGGGESQAREASSEGMAAGSTGRRRGSVRSDTEGGRRHHRQAGAGAGAGAGAFSLAQKHSDHRRRFILDYCMGASHAADSGYHSEPRPRGSRNAMQDAPSPKSPPANYERREAIVRLHKKKEAHRKRFLEMVDRVTALP